MGGQHHTPAVLPPVKRPGTRCIEDWVGHRTGLDGYGISRINTGIRSPDRPARSTGGGILVLYIYSGPGSSVGIANDYGLDCTGIESRCGRDFPHLSRPALGPTQPPIQCVPGLSQGKERPGRDADHSSPSSSTFKKE